MKCMRTSSSVSRSVLRPFFRLAPSFCIPAWQIGAIVREVLCRGVALCGGGFRSSSPTKSHKDFGIKSLRGVCAEAISLQETDLYRIYCNPVYSPQNGYDDPAPKSVAPRPSALSKLARTSSLKGALFGIAGG